ncbi:thiol peroxidase [Actinomyces minihominis]|uniref:thiol peroxidase n=1 Tax=Actinomyces minihominis TaxID=2002838 RepID=UPI000C071AF1|nr:thiol peroxidase [Actinomyces minihominis]
MAKITIDGNEIETVGFLPEKGTQAPGFELVGNGLDVVTNADFAGKRIIMDIFPSVDTGVCAQSVRRFNQIASVLPNTVVLCVSKDLPFAFDRFCGAEGIDNAITVSAFRSNFGDDYGVTMTTGPLQGLLSRSVVVIEPDGTVSYTQQVPEIKQEPDYQLVLEAIDLDD